jgi:hypothetical protein
MRWREAKREIIDKINVECNYRVLVSAMAKRAAPWIETSDDVPLFASSGKRGPTTPPTAATALVRNEDPLQVIQETTGGWRLVRLDGQYVRVKLTRKEMFSIYGGKNAKASEEEDSDPGPDYLVTGEIKPYIDRSQDDDTENLRLFLLISATRGANDARHTGVALGTQTINFTTYSDEK